MRLFQEYQCQVRYLDSSQLCFGNSFMLSSKSVFYFKNKIMEVDTSLRNIFHQISSVTATELSTLLRRYQCMLGEDFVASFQIRSRRVLMYSNSFCSSLRFYYISFFKARESFLKSLCIENFSMSIELSQEIFLSAYFVKFENAYAECRVLKHFRT